MLILRSSPASPFGRKVKIAAVVLGLMDRIEIVNAKTTDPDEVLRQQNPLGKIPALILEDSSSLYDSRVIVEYLDQLAGSGKILPQGDKRFDVLRLQALADGLMDAAILCVYERRFRPADKRFADWQDYQETKIERALAFLEANPPATLTGGSLPDIGAIATACALGYLDLRFDGKWRTGHPKLVDWLDGFESAVPIYAQTKLPAQPVADEPETLR